VPRAQGERSAGEGALEDAPHPGTPPHPRLRLASPPTRGARPSPRAAGRGDLITNARSTDSAMWKRFSAWHVIAAAILVFIGYVFVDTINSVSCVDDRAIDTSAAAGSFGKHAVKASLGKSAIRRNIKVEELDTFFQSMSDCCTASKRFSFEYMTYVWTFDANFPKDSARAFFTRCGNLIEVHWYTE